ncbi:MAG TPA: hypothetical protein VMP67_01245 [Candidatus Limnocylindria bacterium]|nr:hypothetical protein [Candidatus Limnocylindria bacterium]
MTAGDRRADSEAQVDDFFEVLAQLTVEDVFLLGQLWSEEDEATRRRAWQRAKPAIELARLTDLLDEARRDVGAWMQATPSDFQGISGLLGRQADDVSVRRHAAPAVLDAVAGLLAGADLYPDETNALLRPWRAVTDDEEDARTAAG